MLSALAVKNAVAHPNNVTKLVIMEFAFPGFLPPGFEGVTWWFAFHQVPDIPEMLTFFSEQLLHVRISH